MMRYFDLYKKRRKFLIKGFSFANELKQITDYLTIT